MVFDTVQTIAVAGNYTYRTQIDSAFDATTGEHVTILQPLDNTEPVIVDVPAVLTYSTVISGPTGALDGILSVGQTMNLRTVVHRTGTSPYGSGQLRLTIPPNYSFTSDSMQTFSQADTVKNWSIRAEGVTTGINDTLRLNMTLVPFDLNINESVLTGTVNNRIPVRTDSGGTFTVFAAVTSPEGAVDKPGLTLF